MEKELLLLRRKCEQVNKEKDTSKLLRESIISQSKHFEIIKKEFELCRSNITVNQQ